MKTVILFIKMNYENYYWVFDNCKIFDRKVQSKLLKLAKELAMTEWQMLIFLDDSLPDVN